MHLDASMSLYHLSSVRFFTIKSGNTLQIVVYLFVVRSKIIDSDPMCYKKMGCILFMVSLTLQLEADHSNYKGRH